MDISLIAYVGGRSYAYGSIVLKPLNQPIFQQESVRSNIGACLLIVEYGVEFFSDFLTCFAVGGTLNLSAVVVTTVRITSFPGTVDFFLLPFDCPP